MIDFSTYRNHYFKIGDRLWGTLPTGTKVIIIDSYTRFRKDYKQGTGHKPFPLKEGDRVKGGGMYQGGSADMSAAPAMNTGRQVGAGIGIATAAVAAAGADSPTGYTSNVEEYNGTAWSEETNMPTPITGFSACGILTAGLVFGGYNAPPGAGNRDETEEYDGTTWTGGGTMPRLFTEGGGCGTQGAGLAACGNP